MTRVDVRIVGHNLPGLRWCEYERVHAGIQREQQVVGLVPGDAAEAVFRLTVDVVTGSEQGPDFRGPFVHGRRGERFLYLSWGQLAPDGDFAMFRRAKLWLSAADEQAVACALTPGQVLEATLDLTDARGGPLCASVRPPRIRWQVAAATSV
jgi:hypothetical protein